MRKNLFIRVPEEFKTQLKLKAVYENTTLNELVLRALKNYFNEK